MCFVCSCKKGELASSLSHPTLWTWHLPRSEFKNCLAIPLPNFVICILHAWQRIVEKQVTLTLKNMPDACTILDGFFSTLSKKSLREDHSFSEKKIKDIGFIGPFNLSLITKCMFLLQSSFLQASQTK